MIGVSIVLIDGSSDDARTVERFRKARTIAGKPSHEIADGLHMLGRIDLFGAFADLGAKPGEIFYMHNLITRPLSMITEA